MAARSPDTYITWKVICFLYFYFGSSFSQSTTSSTVSESSSIQSSPTASITGNASTIHVSQTSNSSGSLNAGATPPTVVPSASTSIDSQASMIQNNLMPRVPSNRDIEQEFGPLVVELGQKISKKIDPMNNEPSDVKVLKTLVPMLEKGLAFLAKYNHSKNVTNATVDFLNITDSFVMVMKKFNCLKDRGAVIPDRSKKSTRKELGKVTDHVALKFDCPMIVINDTHPANSRRRRRRDVRIEVTMDITANDDDDDDGDFHEFQLLHHHSRYRRSAAAPKQCGSLRCSVKRFETTLIITNRSLVATLQNKSTSYYQDLTKQLTDSLKRVLSSYLTVDKIHNFNYFERSQASNGVNTSFYLDVDGSAITAEKVTQFLKTAAANDTLEQFEVVKNEIKSIHRIVVDGNYTNWNPWSTCDRSYTFTQRRTRICEGSEHGGQCNGTDKEIKKCDCVHHNETVGGNISSPLFPGKYPTGVRCVWVLTAPANHTVKLHLREFHLEKDKKCFYDYMEFFNGNTTTNEQLRNGNRICGTHYDSNVIESSGKTLTVVFNSDKSETFKGFQAEWFTMERSKTVFNRAFSHDVTAAMLVYQNKGTQAILVYQEEKVKKYVPQYVTALTTIYSPNVNGTHHPLGTATTCTLESKTLDQECIFKEKVFVISRLISTHIDRSLPLDGGNRIVVNFEHVMNDQLFPAMYKGQKYCVTWNEEAKKVQPTDDNNQIEQSRGAWTREGCSILTTNITHTSCACNRQGLFAVLGQEKIESGKLKLLANTYIGMGISYFILIMAIVHIVWKIEIHGGEVMRINMCAAIIFMQSIFLIGAHVKAQQTLCGFLAFAIYFAVLAEFCWLLLHGLRIHGKIKKIFASNLNIEIVYVVIGWGLPTLLALIAIGVKIDPKSPDEVCWEAATGSGMWGYAGPVIVIALLNVVVLIKLLIPTEDVKDGYDYKEMRFRVLKDLVFLLCFGLTCTFAYQAVEEERFLEQYLLSAFVIMQALAMFVFGREGRKDFIKRSDQANPQQEPEPANEEPVEENIYEEPKETNIYESIDPETKPKETDLGDGPVKKYRKRASRKQPEKITVSTLQNLNIYKEGGQYVIEA